MNLPAAFNDDHEHYAVVDLTGATDERQEMEEQETRQFRFGSAVVTVESRGAVPQPWANHETAWGYTVTVDIADDEYVCKATGSIADFERGTEEMDAAPEMAAMVADDLVGAANDPDEFWTMATDGVETFDRDRIANILALLDYAKRHDAEVWEMLDYAEAGRDGGAEEMAKVLDAEFSA